MGYRAVGFDISADQLRFARPRLAAAVRADARRLPLPGASADVATGMYFHTDTEDFAAVVGRLGELGYRGGISVEYFDLPEFGWPLADPRAWALDLAARVRPLL